MQYGISDKSYKLIIQYLESIKEVEQVYIFGSRAMGNYRNGSDIDIAVKGKNININIINKISVVLNEKLPIPYNIDVVYLDNLNHKELREHIEKEGKIFYSK